MRKRFLSVIIFISLVTLFVSVSASFAVEFSSFSSPAAASNFVSFGEMEQEFDVVSYLESVSRLHDAEALYRTARCSSGCSQACSAKCSMQCGGAKNSTGCTHTCTSKCSSSSYCNSAESW